MPIGNLPRSTREIQAAARQFDLAPYRENFEELKLLKLRMETAKKEYELYRDRLKARVGDADELILDGQVVATHAISGAFNKAKFAKEQAHLFEQYLVEVPTLVFDEERFAKVHPHLYEGDDYRARSLRFK